VLGAKLVETAIIVDGLSKVFSVGRRHGAFTAVDNISFTVGRGEIFGLLGPNGAGKTTTIRLLLGLMRPSGGHVWVLGLALPAAAKAVHARTGYMSQRFTLYSELTAAENLRFYARVYGLSGSRLRSRFEHMVALVGLAGFENELAVNLPGGWRQRLALACAIIHDPELVFLDEPTAGVDPMARRELWELIYGLADQGRTVFITTHYMDEAELCRRLAFIAGGRIVAMDTPERLKQGSMSGHVLALECDRPEAAERVLRLAQSAPLPDLRDVSSYGTTLRVIVPEATTGEAAIRQCLAVAGIAIHTLGRVEPTMDEVFASTTGHVLLTEQAL
jgi:ABC-2 type transport system ATP-binding protein